MTLQDQFQFDQLDQYIKGTLSASDRLALEEKMAGDEAFRSKAEEHFKFVSSLQQYGERNLLKKQLDTFHHTLPKDKPVTQLPKLATGIRRYWPTLAVAASVALFSIIGTLMTIESLKKKQTADYKELRRNVEQIKKSQRAIIEGIKESKEKVVDPAPADYAGTGFLISIDGYVATSFHVVRDADSVYLENKRFGRLKATVVKTDAERDVAVLKIDSLVFKTLPSLPYSFLIGESDLGETVFTLGFPREDIVYGEGTISASTGYRQNIQTYQIAVPVNPGNSGGPLLNKQGELVGMISGIQTETLGAAFAVKSSVIADFINGMAADSLRQPIQLPKQNKLRNFGRVQQVKKVKDFVFVVKVYNKER